MIDTHTHLYMADAFPDGGASAVKRAFDAGVSHLVMPNVDVASAEPLLRLHDLFPQATSVAKGLHPTEVTASFRDEIDRIETLFSGHKCVAWGEIGLDYHWDTDNAALQREAFAMQLDCAYSQGLPVIIHSRDALDDTIGVARSLGSSLPPLLFHSFTSGPREAERILEAFPDAMFAFNGVVTFKNAPDVREAAALAGISRIMLETDSPYLAPVPFRGRTNESAYLPAILRSVADATATPFERAENVTDANARVFFSLPAPSLSDTAK